MHIRTDFPFKEIDQYEECLFLSCVMTIVELLLSDFSGLMFQHGPSFWTFDMGFTAGMLYRINMRFML